MSTLTWSGVWVLFAFGLRTGIVLLGAVLPTAAVLLTVRYRWELFCAALAGAARIAQLFRRPGA